MSQLQEQEPQQSQSHGNNVVSEPVQMAIDLYGHIRYEPAADRLRILVPHYENNAAGFYRVMIPLIEVQDQRLGHVLFPPDIPGDAQRERAIESADIIVLGRSATPAIIETITELQKFGKKIIVDQDDYPEGVEDTERAETISQWTYDVIDRNQRLIRQADVLTVTNEFLREQYSTLRGKPTIVLPNQIDALNPRWNFKREDHDGIIIGWMAGAVHIPDSNIAALVIKQVLSRCPQARFKAVGFIDEWMQELPKDQTILLPGVNGSADAYPKMMADMDIGIAPLAPNDFNAGKSDLKFLEYTMAGVLPVVQEWGPYLSLPKSVAIHCDDVDSWVETLVDLIQNTKKIKQEYKKALTYVIHQRTIYTHAKQWYESYRSVYN